MYILLPPDHIPKRDLLPIRASHVTPAPAPARLPHKRVFLLALAIPALALNEQAVAVIRAQTACVFKQHVGLALVHFAQDDDVVGVL
jgi:hypothetical protein